MSRYNIILTELEWLAIDQALKLFETILSTVEYTTSYEVAATLYKILKVKEEFSSDAI